MDRYDPERFLLERQVLEAICSPLPHGMYREPPKRETKDTTWKRTHEQFYSSQLAKKGVQWPPHLGKEPQSLVYKEFRLREGEVIYAAVHAFPEWTPNQWSWFDSNHTLERSFNYPVPENGSLRNPWQSSIPTHTSLSAIAGRKIKDDGTIFLKRLHPIEAFCMTGWETSFWRQEPFSSDAPSQTLDVMQSLVGNMWSLYHFVPLALSTFGSVSWSEIHRLEAIHANEKQQSPSLSSQERESDGESDGFGSPFHIDG